MGNNSHNSQLESNNIVLSWALRWHWIVNGACSPVVFTLHLLGPAVESQPCNQVSPAQAGGIPLKGLAQVKIIKKSVILFRVLNMTI